MHHGQARFAFTPVKVKEHSCIAALRFACMNVRSRVRRPSRATQRALYCAVTAHPIHMTPITAESINQLTLSLYRDGRDISLRSFQDWALEQLRGLIAFDSAWWGNGANEPIKIHWLHLHNCDESILETYPPYIPQDFFRAELMAHPGVSVNMSDLTTRERYVRTEWYRNVGKKHRVEWQLGTLLIDPLSSLSEFLTLWRHNPRQPFSEADRQAKELLMPHLVQAFRTVRLRHFLKSNGAQPKAWALADDQGFIRELSPAFAAVLQTHWPAWRGSLLPDVLARCVVDGRAFLSKALAIDVKPSDNLRFLQVKCQSPLDRLTPREGEIVARYAQGETYCSIAAALALSPPTVRNHISRCFKKLEVTNKAELANLLASKRRVDAAGV